MKKDKSKIGAVFFLWLSVDCNTNGEQTIDKNAKINETHHLSIYLGWWGIRN